jgi:YD repeat-containing protein
VDELSGPVHVVKVKTEPVFTAPGEKPVSDGWTPSITTYDRDGNAVEIVTYNDKGEVDQRSVGEVDRSGHKIGEQHFDSDDKLIDVFAWRYDDLGNPIEFKTIGANGSVSGWREFNYDQSGKIVSLLDLNQDGIVVTVTDVFYDQDGREMRESWPTDQQGDGGSNVYSYSNGGKTVETRSFGANGNPDGRSVSSVDEKKNYTEEYYDAAGKLVRKETHEYTRDNQGNWTTDICSERQLRDNKLVLLGKVKTTRTITYF